VKTPSSLKGFEKKLEPRISQIFKKKELDILQFPKFLKLEMRFYDFQNFNKRDPEMML
jgi:hypothetical protein